MPELPEVESIARTLRPLIAGAESSVAEWCTRSWSAPRPTGAGMPLRNTLQNVWPVSRSRESSGRGKYLLISLAQGCLVLHFRFDGQLIWFDDARPRGHVDVTFEMEHGTLAFVDQRHLGRVEWTPSLASVPALEALGIEPLSPKFTLHSLHARMGTSCQPLKPFLLDQSKIAGIGNIYSNEAMWHARIDPRRPANDLSRQDVRRLHKSIVGVLRRALECCLHPAPDFRDPNWWFQGWEATLRVYGREGELCRRCGHAVKRMPQGGRSTFWCPGCQQ